jgi:pantetheine-phosphate adenylyltransferase
MKNNTKAAIYPGTFDPITLGHMSIIERALKIIDQLVIGVAVETAKDVMFHVEHRVATINSILTKYFPNSNVKAIGFSGLLVDFARAQEINLLIRGLRAASDFEYEFQLAWMNTKLASEIETIFLPASDKTHFVSSSIVKQIAKLGGDLKEFVPDEVSQQLKKYYQDNIY